MRTPSLASPVIATCRRSLTSVGIQCALCHSTVDNSCRARHRPEARRLAQSGSECRRDRRARAGPERRRGSAPDVDQRTVRTVLNSWGPGKFDAQLFLDGKAFRPDGKSAATLLPAAFGLAGVNLHTYTGWGGVSHWNAFVANLEMHGQGTFFDARLDDPLRFPSPRVQGFGHVRNDPDLITSKLPALQFYQLSIPAPDPAHGTSMHARRRRGKAVFNGAGPLRHVSRAAALHRAGLEHAHRRGNRHRRLSVERSPDQRYRTTPLAGLFTRQKGGFYHDGRFANLRAVVEHYNQVFNLNLSEQAKKDLIEYLKSS